ncbi:rod shape-determining protein MreC [Synechococcus sp. PCC 6312]|uniref:rod shape-determining protein MreC n=1 Tax=Synechococcus sp. (strain ATCC 27167 / PCC 6312) TaxID=195253 RepID=UPI00029F0B11|nr:rod shape-determining protein MreC [Synechococcus sp. PCC 6312]AFY61354.1 rod shape-determining protein MreC [Synechococcus sp. PCC 6312]
MGAVVRWWTRFSSLLILTGVTLGVAWVVRETNGAGIRELYRVVTLPIYGGVNNTDQLIQARTWELEQRLAEVQSQNDQLRQLLNIPQVKQNKAVVARVIGRSADHWWQQVLLNQGSREGLAQGAVVLASGGVVGRITSITPNTSRILLLTDPSSRVGVVVGRTRQMGILRGQLGNKAVLEFFDKDPKVQPQDAVLTSELSSLFPAGLPVGVIESVDLSDPTRPHAIVQLAAPVDRLEWVQVMVNGQSSQTTLTPSP